jgi:HEAT repeat protein
MDPEDDNGSSVNESRIPDLSGYTDPIEDYVEMYETYTRSINRKLDIVEAEQEFNRRVEAQWGMIAKGVAAVPYALAMLSSKHSEVREDGAGILAMLKRQPEVVPHLLAALETETDEVAKLALIGALGRLRAKEAIPALARLIRDEEEDGDARWNAAEALGLIARRRFVKMSSPIQAALEWLAKHKL